MRLYLSPRSLEWVKNTKTSLLANAKSQENCSEPIMSRNRSGPVVRAPVARVHAKHRVSYFALGSPRYQPLTCSVIRNHTCTPIRGAPCPSSLSSKECLRNAQSRRLPSPTYLNLGARQWDAPPVPLTGESQFPPQK